MNVRTLRTAATGVLLTATAWLLSARALAHAPDVQRQLPQVREYFALGIEHILTGFDHLLFLAALVLGGARLRDNREGHAPLPPRRQSRRGPTHPRGSRRSLMRWPVQLLRYASQILITVTAFTVAHSITLALGVLGLVAPNAQAVEVLIALSIAYVAFENLLGRGGKTRFAVTAGFGLVHGLGFASALAEVGVSQTRMVPSLLLFNVGVEAGQLGVLVFLVPAVRWLQAGGAARRGALRGASAVLVAVGLIWAGERLTELAAPPSAEATPRVPVAKARAQAPETILPRSVYPHTTGALAPGVAPLCRALAALPRERRAACAGRKAGIVLTSECERMLNGAVQSGAVAFSNSASTQCITDQTSRYRGCGFVEAGTLSPPDSCRAVVTGQRTEGGTCRSSLECASGLHCKGVSPVETGTCARPEGEGARCGLAADPLGAYVPARDADHPECAGQCVRNRCTATGER